MYAHRQEDLTSSFDGEPPDDADDYEDDARADDQPLFSLAHPITSSLVKGRKRGGSTSGPGGIIGQGPS